MVKKAIVNHKLFGNIVLEGVYAEIVNCNEFMRLADITQLGTSCVDYPELKKRTRYEHSVGAYHVMEKIIKKIQIELQQIGLNVNKREIEVAKIAILLHDVGHCAYSHTQEYVSRNFA